MANPVDTAGLQSDLSDLESKRTAYNTAATTLDSANAAQASAQADYNVKRQALHDAAVKMAADVLTVDPSPSTP